MARTVLDRSDAVRPLAGVFRKRGFEGSSLSVIRQETGIGRGSLYDISRERVCLFAAMTLGEEQDTFADAMRTYFTDWVDALAGALRTGGLSPQEAPDRALDAVAAIEAG